MTTYEEISTTVLKLPLYLRSLAFKFRIRGTLLLPPNLQHLAFVCVPGSCTLTTAIGVDINDPMLHVGMDPCAERAAAHLFCRLPRSLTSLDIVIPPSDQSSSDHWYERNGSPALMRWVESHGNYFPENLAKLVFDGPFTFQALLLGMPFAFSIHTYSCTIQESTWTGPWDEGFFNIFPRTITDLRLRGLNGASFTPSVLPHLAALPLRSLAITGSSPIGKLSKRDAEVLSRFKALRSLEMHWPVTEALLALLPPLRSLLLTSPCDLLVSSFRLLHPSTELVGVTQPRIGSSVSHVMYYSHMTKDVAAPTRGYISRP